MARAVLASILVILGAHSFSPAAQSPKQTSTPRLRAGAATSNITPPLGEPIVGNWTPVPATYVHDELHARCLVLDDGETRIAIVMADNVGIPRRVLDEAKRQIQTHTSIAVERILIASTHTHSATTARTGADRDDASAALTEYQNFLATRISDGVRRAVANLEPARIAWGSGSLPEQVFNRRWFMQPGPHLTNPFGGTDQVMMNPPVGSPDLIKPAGPTDPEISFVSVQSESGRPIALLANYSLHYVGGVPNGHISADYFAVFARQMARSLERDERAPPFVAMLSNGTSGNINNINFRGGQTRLPPYARMELVANQVAAEVFRAMQRLEYHESVPLKIVQRELTLETRRPEAEKLAGWAKDVLARPESVRPNHPRERIYAERTLQMLDMPPRIDVPLQVLRIGDLAIATIPFEVFVEMGLELKAKSPFPDTFVVSLANGAYGYLPTAAHHTVGGYETWLGTNRVEVRAAAKIVEALLQMLGEVKLPRDGRNAGGPLSPEQARASFELEDGYRIELAAAEPLIQSPVAIAFDERARMYVVENRGYPGSIEGAQQDSEGSIALLEDTDGDGRFDKRSEFARGLMFPNGVMPWSGGVFVTAAPDILYLKDTNGDGVADERRVVLTGFETTKTPQIRVSHPTLGLDNWVYLTSGLNGGRVTSAAHPGRPPVTFTTSDSRFNPFTFDFELTGGRSQYGLTFDDYGRRFTCANRNPVWHVVLEPHYLKRNPYLAFSETIQEVSTVGAQAAVWPTSADMTTASFMPSLMGAPHAGTFTAASGVHLHRGDALPEAHRNSVFICESAQNLVQRQVLSPSGATFTSKPAQNGREFLASRDNWFRPVFAANGPDGALYIVDMYRKTIDHPQYLPEASRPLLDFEAGRERGRIYRIVAKGWSRRAPRVSLDRASASQLVESLEDSNAWRRETAQRLLVERRERGAISSLRSLVVRSERDVARVHALWTLSGLGGLEVADVTHALRDRSAGVRENAVRLAEAMLSTSPVLVSDVLRLAQDPDPRVRFHVALALGDTKDSRAAAALASIARRDGADSWVRAAILSGLEDRLHEFVQAFSASPAPAESVRAAIIQDLGQLFGASETPDRCLEFILQITSSDENAAWQPGALVGLARGLQGRGAGSKDRSALMTLLTGDSPEARLAAQRVAAVVKHATAVAVDHIAPTSSRLGAIGLLGFADYSRTGDTLKGLLTPQHPGEIQVAAVRALSQMPEPSAVAALLGRTRWASFTPEVREAALAALTRDEARTLMLLDAIEEDMIPGTTLTAARRNRLTNHRNPAIQKRARTLLAPFESGNRMQTYERLRGAVLARQGFDESGKRVFTTYCANCHSFKGSSGTLGPDLSGIRNQPAEAILLHVLVPDYEITPGYYAYVVETKDGRTLVGRLQSETPNGVTLQDASSQQHVVLRGQIASMTASPNSLMPNELERAMSEQDLADVIRYLKGGAGSKQTERQ